MDAQYQNDSTVSLIMQLIVAVLLIALASLLMGIAIAFVWNHLIFVTGLPAITWKTGVIISWALSLIGSYFKSTSRRS